ncbi:MAG: hypothetical protein U9N87_07515 [Planctomycetota bacterium]|nr:hypothetical protein [Planctomycetota bacterium]
MSNIDDDAPELELDDLNMPSDGMPDPTTAEPAAADTAAEPTLADDAEHVDDLLENVEAEDDTDKPTVEKEGLWVKFSQASPYTVMLAISVLAIGVALLCLIFEWNTYSFQRKPPKTLTMSRFENARFPAVYGLNSQRNSLDLVERRTS